MVASQEPTVMIVDDLPFMRNILHTMLEVNGYIVVAEAENGFEAITRYRDLKPKIIFMDVIMPIKSGIDATKEILSIDNEAIIVICSSLGDDELVKTAIESGARDVIVKPYKIDRLIDVLQRLNQC
jgi:two-component system chemotaxis response regulator CheY